MTTWVLAEDLGIETLGGVFTPMLKQGTPVPCDYKEVFSTAEDNQSAVSIRLAQGSDATASANRPLGTFDLAGIPPSPRGVPQIEVTIRVDAEGAVSVTAHDQATSSSNNMHVAANTEHRVKLREATASPRLENPINLQGANGEMSVLIPAGDYLPSSTRLTVRTAEDNQELMSIRLYEGDNKPLGSVTIRTKGNQSKAGATIALAIDCVARADGTVELVNNNESANPGTLLYTADEKVNVVEGGGQSQTNTENTDFAKTFDDVFGDLFKSKPETAPEQEPTQPDEPALRIFVSHASSDANYAQTVVSQVEGQTSRKCWVAPRDVRPGFDYRSEILESIKSCSHCIVLMSDAANSSDHVLREISLADQYSKRIVMVKINDVGLRSELEYLLHGRHWVMWESVKNSLASLV